METTFWLWKVKSSFCCQNHHFWNKPVSLNLNNSTNAKFVANVLGCLSFQMCFIMVLHKYSCKSHHNLCPRLACFQATLPYQQPALVKVCVYGWWQWPWPGLRQGTHSIGSTSLPGSRHIAHYDHVNKDQQCGSSLSTSHSGIVYGEGCQTANTSWLGLNIVLGCA